MEETLQDRIKRLVRWVKSTTVVLPAHNGYIHEPGTYGIDTEWLLDNIGEMRSYSIYMEACVGYIDYLDGDWSYSWRCGYMVFWFSTQLQAAKFMLMFGGQAGAMVEDLDE